jgi:hypothetical protein
MDNVRARPYPTHDLNRLHKPIQSSRDLDSATRQHANPRFFPSGPSRIFLSQAGGGKGMRPTDYTTALAAICFPSQPSRICFSQAGSGEGRRPAAAAQWIPAASVGDRWRRLWRLRQGRPPLPDPSDLLVLLLPVLKNRISYLCLSDCQFYLAKTCLDYPSFIM